MFHHLRQAAHPAGDHRHARGQRLQGHQPERLGLARQQQQVRRAQVRRHVVDHPDQPDAVDHPELARQVGGRPEVGAVADQHESRRHLARHPREHAHHVGRPLDGPEVGDVHDGRHALGGGGGAVPRPGGGASAPVVVGIDEVRDHLDRPGDPEHPAGLRAQRMRHGGHRIRALDAEGGHRPEAVVAAHQRDVGAVQGGHHLQVELGRDLLGQDGRRRERDRVMDVQDPQAMRTRDLRELGRQRQRVGELLEERILLDRDLVETDARRQHAQAQRRRVAHERHRVAALGQPQAELGGDHAAAAVGRVAGDAYSHGVLTMALITAVRPRREEPAPHE